MLIRFILFSFLFYLLYRIIRYFYRAKSARIKSDQPKVAPATGEDLMEDPACHTYVPVSQAYKKEIAGKDYYFCSKECCNRYISEKKQ